jgi:hypothetical protein
MQLAPAPLARPRAPALRTSRSAPRAAPARPRLPCAPRAAAPQKNAKTPRPRGFGKQPEAPPPPPAPPAPTPAVLASVARPAPPEPPTPSSETLPQVVSDRILGARAAHP